MESDPETRARVEISTLRCARILATLTCVMIASTSWAEEDHGGDVFEMSLDELLNLEVSVASIGAKTIREQSAIVTVITAKEIAATGARDLVDVLWLVPGFHFGADVEGITGIGVRGFWAYEGKILITIDGMEITEDLYGVVPVDEHIPVDQIEHIEIIRGPGSAMYGGTAELSVINITTKGAALNGGFVNADFGTDSHDVSGRVGGGAGWGNDDLHMHINGSWNSSYRSTSKYMDNDWMVWDFDDHSDIKSLLLTTGLDYKDFEFRFLLDSYRVDDTIQYGWAVPPLHHDNFDTLIASGKYDFRVSDQVTITPKVSYKYQRPWYLNPLNDMYEVSSQRVTADLTGVGTLGALGPVDSVDVLMGGEFSLEGARANRTADPRAEYYHGNRRVYYENYAAFLQTDFESRWLNVTLGGRYHYHSEVGGKLVPRVALTRAWERFHTKALFSQAFRTPQIELIEYGGRDGSDNPTVDSETTTAYEIEGGYRFSDTVSFVVNVFWIEIADILVYANIASVDSYQNWDKVVNYGLEAEMRVVDDWGNVAIGYSFYRNHENDVPGFCTSGPELYMNDNYDEDPNYANCRERNGLLLGFPAHKLTFNGTYFITDYLSFNLNGAFISKRISYGVGMLDRKTLGSRVFANVFLRVHKAGFSVGVGVRDLFDKQYDYVQPFDSGVRELPGKGREFFMKASYEFDGIPFR